VTALPRVAELLPHVPPMLLLDELLDAGPGFARCAVRITEDSVFVEEGRVRAVVALEYMGQTAAALAGLESREGGGRRPAAGLLLGTRELTLRVPCFEVGDELLVEVKEEYKDERLSSFRCRVRRAGETVAEAVLNVRLSKEQDGPQ